MDVEDVFFIGTGFERIRQDEFIPDSKNIQCRTLVGATKTKMYMDGGKTSPKLVLLIDFYASFDHYLPLIRRLAKQFRVMTFDWPGQGGSDFLDMYSVTALKNTLNDLLEFESWNNQRFHVLAHGAGAIIAANYFCSSECPMKRACSSLTLIAPTLLNVCRIIAPQVTGFAACCAAPPEYFLEMEVNKRVKDSFAEFSPDIESKMFKKFNEIAQENRRDETNDSRLESLKQQCEKLLCDHPNIFKQLVDEQSDTLKIGIILGKSDKFISKKPDFSPLNVEIFDSNHFIPFLQPTKLSEYMNDHFSQSNDTTSFMTSFKFHDNVI